MLDGYKKILAFLRSMVSEGDGSISNTRVCIVIVIAFASGWVTALVTKVRGPVALPELSVFVENLGVYVSGICLALYGTNRFADAWKNRGGDPPKQQDGNPPEQQDGNPPEQQNGGKRC